MPKLNFEAAIEQINDWLIVRIPKSEDDQLSSRGMVIVKGSLNLQPFQTELEPDGQSGHWFQISPEFVDDFGLKTGDRIQLVLEPIENWYEPEMPEDFMTALTDENLLEFWDTVTPKAKWEWLRWIQFTNNPATRQKRIEVSCSKLHSGKKRPCCFDQSRCTVMAVSKNGVLRL